MMKSCVGNVRGRLIAGNKEEMVCHVLYASVYHADLIYAGIQHLVRNGHCSWCFEFTQHDPVRYDEYAEYDKDGMTELIQRVFQ